MRKMKILFGVMAGLALATMVSSVQAQNFDFENWWAIGNDPSKWSSESNPDIPTAILADDEFWSNPSSFGNGWTSTGVQASNGKYGLQHPKKSTQQNMTNPFNGDFIGFMNLTEGDGVGSSAGTVESNVLGALAEGTYDLTVAVGARPSSSWNDVSYTISLISGGSDLGTPSSVTLVPSTAVIGSSTQDLSYSLVIPAASPLIGQNFQIRIGLANAGTKDGATSTLDTFTQANFDNVRLSLDGVSIPEPATMTMLGLGGLALLRRRKNA